VSVLGLNVDRFGEINASAGSSCPDISITLTADSMFSKTGTCWISRFCFMRTSSSLLVTFDASNPKSTFDWPR
jgi:hypothetical protein